MVLGVAFVSISAQAWALSSYVRKKFPAGHADALNVRLSKALAAIESLEKLQAEGKMTGDAFAAELEKEKDELRELLSEIHRSVGTRDILRSRAGALYGSVLSLPMSKAMAVMRRNKMDRTIESLVKRISGEGGEEAEGSDSDGEEKTQ
jgi:hypothetical protein